MARPADSRCFMCRKVARLNRTEGGDWLCVLCLCEVEAEVLRFVEQQLIEELRLMNRQCRRLAESVP